MADEFKWRPFNEEEKKLSRTIFGPKSVMLDLWKSEPLDVCMPKAYVDRGYRKMLELKVRDDDVWIVTYPKCGTTLTQELMWQIMNDGESQNEGMKNGWQKVHFIEFCDLLPSDNPETPLRLRDGYTFADQLESPRLIKSHLPFEMLPPDLLKTAKVVYVCRHPIDVAVSYFHHHKLGQHVFDVQGDLDQFIEGFMKGMYFHGDYWGNLKSAWAKKANPNMLFLWYEDIRADLPQVIRKLAKFLEKDFPEDKVQNLADLMKIDNFREKFSEAAEKDEDKKVRRGFVRAGTVGNWKDPSSGASSESYEKMFAWMKQHLEGTDIPLYTQ